MSHPPVERFPEDQDDRRQRPDEAVVVHLPTRGMPPATPERPRRYSSEFRADAVALARRPGVSVAAAARELEISPSTLRRWLREAPAAQPDPGPASERLDDGWPDWRSFDWPVLPAADSEPPAAAAPVDPGEAGVDPLGEPIAQPAPDPPPSPAVVRDLAAAAPGDGIFAATARLDPVHRLVVVLTAFAACILLSRLVPESYPWRPTVGALHVMSLVVSFGAVLLVDWHGLLWLAGRRALTESTRLAAAAAPIIWLGLGGLFVTGALLRPDVGSPLTLLKLVLVLAVAVNGAVMAPVRLRLAALSADASPVDVPEREWRQMMLSTAVSQVGWWGAVVIGFVNAAT